MTESQEIRMIPIERITVLNPRERNKRVFGDIVTNVAHLGLKRPITVTRRDKGDGPAHYDLVCGQGRLEACRARGDSRVTAAGRRSPRADLGAEAQGFRGFQGNVREAGGNRD